ncbi:MAG: hypothetical protein ACREB8_02770 [Pseudolabrys sp.]
MRFRVGRGALFSGSAASCGHSSGAIGSVRAGLLATKSRAPASLPSRAGQRGFRQGLPDWTTAWDRMDAAEFFKDVAEFNYQEFNTNPGNLRHLWNAIVSMNTVAEYVALDQLGYSDVPRAKFDVAAKKIRDKHPILNDLKYCAETFKHVRKIKDHPKLGSGFSTIAASTGVSDDPTTWQIGQHKPVEVLRRAVAALSSFPELK